MAALLQQGFECASQSARCEGGFVMSRPPRGVVYSARASPRRAARRKGQTEEAPMAYQEASRRLTAFFLGPSTIEITAGY